MGNFRELMIWKVGMDIADKTYSLSKNLPESEKYGLVSQIQRAATSIPSNIAEGSSRNSQKEFKRFVEISLGSCYELETQLQVIVNQKMINEEITLPLIELITEEQKMINGFIKSLRKT